MAFRPNQLRAVLIPVSVALISIGALAWYGMYWIPAQRRSLDERNVRLLRTIAAQIKVKVNNFDQAIDNAIESFEPDSTRPISKDFPAYVKLFTPDLEIIDSADDHPKLAFHDPPVVKVVLDEGKHYLYLGYSHGVLRNGAKRERNHVIGRADIAASVGTYLSSHPEFDAIALLDHDGRAIAQQSTTGVEITTLDTTDARRTKRAGRDSAGGIENVTIGGADYRFYVQPVQLSLVRDTTDVPEEWKLCGLVRVEQFRSASAEISSTYWLLLLAGLTALLLAIPIVKLHVVHPRERYDALDGVATAVSSFLLSGLLAFALLDAFYFGYRSNRESDGRLSAMARDLNTSFATEVHAASHELDVQVNALDSALRGRTVSDTGRRRIRLSNKDTFDCFLPLVCRTDLLLDPSATGQGRYPYYRLITWSDSIGRQRYKWTSWRKVTPFIDISALPYVDDARQARRLRYDSTVAQRGLSVIRSPNTGEALTVLWRALPPREPENLRMATLVTTPISMTRPFLTYGVHFAVVDLTGQVLYHSDSARSLNENFVQEATMDNGAVRAAVVGRTSGSLSAEYSGRRYRMYVQPIDVSPGHGLADPQWSLIIFEQGLIRETVNLEALTLAVLMFAAYSLLLAIGWGVAHSAWPHGIDKWFWPDARLTFAYKAATAVNAVLGLTFLFVVARRSPPVLLGVTLVMSLIAIATTFVIVRYSKHEDEQPPHAEFHWFLTARVSFLFVVGVVPAMAAFQVAEGYENGLLLRRRSMHATSESAARIGRIARQQRLLRLCRSAEGCPEATAFLKQRLEPLAYELPVPPTDITHSQASPATLGFASRLARGHFAYNNVAVDLRAAMPGDSAGIFQPYLGFLVLGALLALLVVFVVRTLVWPLYMLDLYRRPGFTTSLGHKPSGNVLLVAQTASRETNILLELTPGGGVVDVEELAFAGAGPSPLLHSPTQAARVGPAQSRGAAWVDSLNVLAIPENGVLAIGQFEYRMDDPLVRDLTLPVPENLVYRRNPSVWIASSSGPVEPLNVDPPIADAAELVRMLSTEPLPSREDVLFEFGVAAESYYRAVFGACSMDQKLALYQLAETHVVNPRNHTVVAQLMRKELVRRDPKFRVMNETFSRFITREMSHESATEWEREGVRLPWGSISTMMLTLALLLLCLMLLTQQQLLGAWAGILPTLTPMLPSVLKLISAAPFGAKRGAVPA